MEHPPKPETPDPAVASWRLVAATGVTGLFLGVAFPYIRVGTWSGWAERIGIAARAGWVDGSTLLTAGAFGVTAAAAVLGMPRTRPLWVLAAALLFGVLNEAWQAAFILRHAQLGDVAAAGIGATLGVGLARRLPGLVRFGRPAAGATAVFTALAFSVVLGMAAVKSEIKTERFGTGPPDGFLRAEVDSHGGFEGRYRWKISTPFYTPERLLGRPDGRRGVPLGATMALVAGLAAAGLGRTPGSRVRWALAGAAAPFAVVLASLFVYDTPWQGTPSGLVVGALLAAAAVRWPLRPGFWRSFGRRGGRRDGSGGDPSALRSARDPAAGPG